jgi:hypothetical protein
MKSRIISAWLAAATLMLLAAAPASAQQEYSFEGSELLVTNLAGEVTVRGHSGSRIIVRPRAGGDDADVLRFEVKEGGRAEFHVVYPLSQSLRYHYPRRRGGSTQFRLEGWIDESSFLENVYSDVSGRDKIKVGGDVGGSSLEAYADLEILIPRGVASRIKVAVGSIEASDVEGDLDLDTHSGPIDARNISGDTRLDTGSGRVTAAVIRGSLNADTGSGRVEVSDVEGDDVLIDTGSGSVTLDGAKARSVQIDTGSGSVSTSNVDADDTMIDTGSGSVTLDLVRLTGGRHVIDTGSGGVTLMLPSDASVVIRAETGSGGIDLDVAAQLKSMSRDRVELQIGDGRASVEIDTGSGSIRIRGR